MKKINRFLPSTCLILLTVLTLPSVHAGENQWLYAKGTDTRPKGSFEFKISDIIKVGKGSGDYVSHDFRPEIEYGITDKLSVNAELVFFDHNYSVDDAENDPVFSTQGGTNERYNKTQFAGYEIGLKYNILSPYKDMFGLSVGLAFEHRDHYRLDGADIDQDSITTNLFFQKDFLDDTLIFVINPKAEFERRKTPNVLEEEISLELMAAVSYRFIPRWTVGLEYRSQSDYLSVQENGKFEEGVSRSSFDLTDFRLGDRFQSGQYIGPTIHYAEQRWWATAGILFQFQGGGGFSKDGKNYDEHERYHTGFSFGYEF
ncbi:MAG: hypothetical protein CL866_00470 [Cycloclasticus sp.]|nr:hypothetical protein [Cycloclasticus sp.]MBG95331.1 hypothetical protein [Cycloclasticus sp.]HAI97884.1 hypothetical protein [Methylococcaceae bacterium]|tara:strand:- start:1517 stop:2461 length:945 start_codon:yes stop_codon:yes gene_type:complete